MVRKKKYLALLGSRDAYKAEANMYKKWSAEQSGRLMRLENDSYEASMSAFRVGAEADTHPIIVRLGDILPPDKIDKYEQFAHDEGVRRARERFKAEATALKEALKWP